MKKRLLVVLFVTLIPLSGCQVKKSEEQRVENIKQTSFSNDNNRGNANENHYATEEDVLKREPITINNKEFILYTFKGNKALALPKEVSLEEATVELSSMPEVGTPKEKIDNQ